MLEEPSTIAIDDSTGAVAATGTAAESLADKEPKDIRVIHPLRDGVIADLDATAEMLHGFLRKSGALSGPFKRRALVCVPGGATWVERRSVVAAFGTRRPRCVVELVDEPVAAAAGAGFDLSAGAGGFVVDVGGGTTEVGAVAGWRVVRAQSLRMAGNAMDEAIINAARSGLGMILSQRAARQLKTELGLTGGPDGWAEAVGLDAARRTPRIEKVPGDLVATALEPVVAAIGATVQRVLSDIPAGLAEDVVAARSGSPAAARCCPASRPASGKSRASAWWWRTTRCAASCAARPRCSPRAGRPASRCGRCGSPRYIPLTVSPNDSSVPARRRATSGTRGAREASNHSVRCELSEHAHIPGRGGSAGTFTIT